jgi:hypothetical protein
MGGSGGSYLLLAPAIIYQHGATDNKGHTHTPTAVK